MNAPSPARLPGPVQLFFASRALGPGERAHLAVRRWTAPWDRVVDAVADAERSVLDVGCGPGLLAWLLAARGFAGRYVGVDPDGRKISRARAWLGETPARSFVEGRVGALGEDGVDRAALVDVLYLVPREARPALVAQVAARLAPGGRLVVLTSGGGPRWKRTVDRLQERAAVLLGVTRGEVVAPCDGAEVAALLEEAGLVGVRVEDVGAGFVHGFELVRGCRGSARS